MDLNAVECVVNAIGSKLMQERMADASSVSPC